MKSPNDKLYTIFEQHLLNALVEEETTDEFLSRVVQDYILQLGTVVIPHGLREMVETDLRDEVLEMLRKRTYGHYSLKEFRHVQRTAATKTLSDKTLPETKAAPVSAANKSHLRMRRPRRNN